MFDVPVWATVLGIINTVVAMIACPIIASYKGRSVVERQLNNEGQIEITQLFNFNQNFPSTITFAVFPLDKTLFLHLNRSGLDGSL